MGSTYACTGKVLGDHVRRLLLVDEDDDRRGIFATVENLQQPLSRNEWGEISSARG